MTENLLTIDNIILSYLKKDEISLEDKKLLEDWIASDPANKEYFKQVYNIWNTLDLLNEDKRAVDKALQRVKFNITKVDQSKKSIPNILYSFGKWAAVIVIALFTGALVYHSLAKNSFLSSQQTVYNEITVPLGSKSKIRLPDGTEVTLNAGSKLTYNMDYGIKLREVNFSGEGYFKVAKQKDKPFIVHTSKAAIKALGTEFNVKAYPDENIIETILVEGSVVINELNSLGKSQKNKSVTLIPGQKAQIFKTVSTTKQIANSNRAPINTIETIENNTEIKIAASSTQVETSWKDKRWIIQGENLENLAVLLSRRFDIDIQLKDQELKNYKFSGLLENETLEQILHIMKFTIPISYTIEKGIATWAINRKKEKDYKESY